MFESEWGGLLTPSSGYEAEGFEPLDLSGTPAVCPWVLPFIIRDRRYSVAEIIEDLVKQLVWQLIGTTCGI